MRLLYFAEIVVIALVLLVFGTQVFFPLWRGTPIFPFFRRERKLEAQLAKLRQVTLEADIERDIAREEKRGRPEQKTDR